MLGRIFGGGIGDEETIRDAGSGTHAAVVLTFPAVVQKKNILTKLVWSYSGDPTSGNLVTTGLAKNINVDITKGGPGALQFGVAEGTTNTIVTVTLADGGVGIAGKLYVEGIVK
jgi:hypothetical protein